MILESGISREQFEEASNILADSEKQIQLLDELMAMRASYVKANINDLTQKDLKDLDRIEEIYLDLKEFAMSCIKASNNIRDLYSQLMIYLE